MIRNLFAAFTLALLATACATAPKTNLDPASSARVLAAQIRSGETSAEAAMRTYLARINAYDQDGPRLHAIIALNPNAMAEARQMDREAARGEFRGALHGVPVLVKDNVETRELPTTAGSLALAYNTTGRDAPIIANLRAAGAIILGKTNLSEWANFRSTSSNSGWSGLGGQVRNPHSLDRSPCGSSAGSAAAIAAAFAPLAIGTETNGSIMCPSAMNGVYGFKPSVGQLSRTHIIPISSTQDTAGPMARSVYDLALMMNAMAGPDPMDPASLPQDQYTTDFVAALEDDIQGVRIGVMRFAQGDMPAVRDAFDDSLTTLEGLGAVLVEIEEFDRDDAVNEHEFFILQTEFKTTLDAYLASAAPRMRIRSLADLIAYHQEDTREARRELAIFDIDILEMSEATGGVDNPAYAAALTALLKGARENGIDHLLKTYDVDVLVAPSRPPAFLTDVIFSDSYPDTDIGADGLAAVAGYPNLAVPMGKDRGLPISLSIMAGMWDDAIVLRVGHHLSQANERIAIPTYAAGPLDLPGTKDSLSPWPRN